MNLPKPRLTARQSRTACIYIKVDIFSQVTLTAQGEQQVLKAPHHHAIAKKEKPQEKCLSYIGKCDTHNVSAYYSS